MKKIFILIILLIILIQVNYYLNYEHYYTFFEPFEKKHEIILNTNKNNFIYDEIIFITFKEFNNYFKNLIKNILKTSNILNIYLHNDYNYKQILKNIDSNIYKFALLPNPLVFSYDYNSLNNTRFIGNIFQYEIIFIYNSTVNNQFKFTDFDDINDYISNNEIYIHIDEKNSIDNLIIRNLINRFKYKKNIILKNNNEDKNISDLLNNKLIFYMFVDFQNKKISNLLNFDYENKIRLISIKQSNLNKFNKENNVYFDKIIKFKHNNMIRFKHNNINHLDIYNLTTLSFSNVIITNKFIDDKLIYLITSIIYSNLSINNNMSNINYFNIPLPMLYVHEGAKKFFLDKGFTTYSSNNLCKNYFSKSKCPY